MPKFSYTVKDNQGNTIKNLAEIDSKDRLIKALQNKGLFIVNITEITGSTPPIPQQRLAPAQKPEKKVTTTTNKPLPRKKGKKYKYKKVKLDDLLSLSRQLATMLESGVSLVRSLNVIQTQAESQTMAETLITVKNNVERGATLSQALAKHPKVFDQFWISLMEVGEASGTIPTVLNKLSFYMEQQAKFRSTIISGIIYPAVLFSVCLGAIAFFALFVGPRFEKIFTAMNADLPWITTNLLALFRFIKKHFFMLIVINVIGFTMFNRYIKTYSGRTQWEKFLFTVPNIGDVYRNIIVERFCSQMAILIDAGVPILYALDITERLVNNNTCAAIVKSIKDDVKQGHMLVTPMEKSGFFPGMALQMILVGEETGELSKMLKHVAKYYQELVETFMKRFATIIEPVMLVFMGAVIGTIVTAMFLPMFNISQLGGSIG